MADDNGSFDMMARAGYGKEKVLHLIRTLKNLKTTKIDPMIHLKTFRIVTFT